MPRGPLGFDRGDDGGRARVRLGVSEPGRVTHVCVCTHVCVSVRTQGYRPRYTTPSRTNLLWLREIYIIYKRIFCSDQDTTSATPSTSVGLPAVRAVGVRVVPLFQSSQVPSASSSPAPYVVRPPWSATSAASPSPGSAVSADLGPPVPVVSPQRNVDSPRTSSTPSADDDNGTALPGTRSRAPPSAA